MDDLRRFIDNEPFFNFLYPQTIGAEEKEELKIVEEWKKEQRKRKVTTKKCYF
jgi:uncharacterized membrane protein YkgB